VSEPRSLRLLAYTDSAAIGGAELALGYLLGALAPRIEVGVIATDIGVGEAIAPHRPDVPVHVVRAPDGTGDHAALRAHLGAIRAFAPDIVHANQAWPWACGYGELAALLTPGVRVVAVDHLPVSGAIPRRRVVARRLLARRLHAHVSVGESSARLIEDIVGLPAGSVGAVPNGVPAAPGNTAPELAHTPGLVIGSLGRLTAQKGYDQLVRVLPDLPGATVVLVGDGPEREALQALAAALGVDDRLLITGWTADARSYLPRFDIFALPSLWEGMPLSILEAMHAGLPVVASAVGSVAEAVGDGDTGYVVPPGDRQALKAVLARLLADPELRSRMGSRARAIASERFTAEVMARCYEEIYRELVPAGIEVGGVEVT
jgi:glycosyltransferase involved in cell wall biosynthesis